MIAQPGCIVRRLLLAAVLASGIAACGGHPAVRPAPAPASAVGIGDRAAAAALRQVGVPYRYGGSGPGGFDCSGLVYYAYAVAGKSIPRTTAELWAQLTPVDPGEERIGDLLFFNISGQMSHVGLFVGGGRFVHAPSSGRSVSIERLNSAYYRKAFIRAGRPR